MKCQVAETKGSPTKEFAKKDELERDLRLKADRNMQEAHHKIALLEKDKFNKLKVPVEKDKLCGVVRDWAQSDRKKDGPSRREDGPSRREDGPSWRGDGPSRRVDGPSGSKDGPSRREDGPSRRVGGSIRREEEKRVDERKTALAEVRSVIEEVREEEDDEIMFLEEVLPPPVPTLK